MTPADDGFPDDRALDVFALLEELLPGVRLTPGQLAQVRAADAKLQTSLFDLGERARAAGRPWTSPTPAECAELRAVLVDDLRGMLTEAERPAFDRRAAGRDAGRAPGRDEG